MKFRDVHRHTHAFTAGEEVAVKSLWIDSYAALLRVLTPALIPAALHSDSTEKANNFPFGRHFPNAVWIMPSRSELPDSLNSLKFLWDGNSLLHPWMPPAILISPNRKGESCLQCTTTACHKNQHRADPGSQPNSCQCLIPSATPEPGPSTARAKKCFLKTMPSKSS